MPRVPSGGRFDSIVKPFLWFLMYLCIAVLGSVLFYDRYGFAVDAGCFAVTSVIMSVFMRFEASSGPGLRPPEWYGGLSFFGWTVILIAFTGMYVTSEMAGTYLMAAFPDAGITGTYTEMTDGAVYGYLAMSLTVGPVCEELLFRWGMFAHFRRRWGFWLSYLVSSAMFTLVHGTLMHIPVTMGLSLFLSVLYDVTGRFRYCVVFHMLFNWMGATLLFSVAGIPPWVRFAAYGAVMAVMACAYMFRERVFGKYLKTGGMARFEAYLDEKRRHIGEDRDDDSGR